MMLMRTGYGTQRSVAEAEEGKPSVDPGGTRQGLDAIGPHDSLQIVLGTATMSIGAGASASGRARRRLDRQLGEPVVY